jgi:hypothetical protein
MEEKLYLGGKKAPGEGAVGGSWESWQGGDGVSNTEHDEALLL